MTHQYFAKPYNICVPGFYFSDYDDYCARMAALQDSFGTPVEEVSLAYIDGDNAELFNALEITQATLENGSMILNSLTETTVMGRDQQRLAGQLGRCSLVWDVDADRRRTCQGCLGTRRPRCGRIETFRGRSPQTTRQGFLFSETGSL